MLEWTKADEEAFARSVCRLRWVNAVHRAVVVTVAQLRALSEEQLREMANLGPTSVADIWAALGDPALRSDDPIGRSGHERRSVLVASLDRGRWNVNQRRDRDRQGRAGSLDRC